MSYYLLVTALVAILAVIYVWYKCKYLNYIPDDVILKLGGSDASLLSKFFDEFLKPDISFDLNEENIAANLIKRLYKKDVDPDLLVVGEDAYIHYTLLTGKILDIDNYYDLRSAIGLNLEALVITNSKIREILKRRLLITCMPEVSELIKLELDVVTKEYLKQILEYRWNVLKSLNNHNIINKKGSYLYISDCEIPNVEIDEKYKRINLLCTDAEFETLVKRLPNATTLPL